LFSRELTIKNKENSGNKNSWKIVYDILIYRLGGETK